MIKYFLTILALSVFSFIGTAQNQVEALYETDPPLNWNSADDPAIWVHPTMNDSSFFIGTDKSGLGRLELYEMDGSLLWNTPTGTRYNNVDVIYGFVLGSDTVDLVSASNNSDFTLDYFKVDPETRTLIDVTGSTATGLTNLYGYILHRDLCTGKFYSFLTLRNSQGYCYQFEFYDNGNGGVDSELVRIIDNLPSRTEGMVADPTYNYLYIAQENKGIWRYGAHPDDGNERFFVDSTSGPNLTSLVEGLCIYHINDSSGYLIASSQGANNFQVYDREGDNEYIDTFEVIAGDSVDDCYHSDGIDVMSFPVSSVYPEGVFIAHDWENDIGPANYKMIPWQRIADTLGLEISPFNPRSYFANLCDTIPIDTIPIDTIPIDTIPIDTIPIDTIPIDTTGTDTTVSLQDILMRRSFIIYPNPVRDRLNIKYLSQGLKNEEMFILDARGKIIYRRIGSPDVIELDFLEPGVYFIKIGPIVQEFIKL